jgi:hypothetical protein
LTSTASRLLFTDNETNPRRHFDQPDATGISRMPSTMSLIGGNAAAANPAHTGTKAGLARELSVPARGSVSGAAASAPAGARKSAALRAISTRAVATTQSEADAFYADCRRSIEDADARAVQRQAFAGMIWSKQFFHYDVPQWLQGDPGQPPPPPSAATAATTTGSISTTPTSCRCRTSGSIRGTRPGTSPSTACRWR